MSKEIKCKGCLQKLEAYRNSLNNRKDWEVKAKEKDQEQITYWKNAYENPKTEYRGTIGTGQHMYGCAYYCEVAGMPNSQSLDSVEKHCGKCNITYDLQCNEHDDVETDSHLVSCQGKKCSKCGGNFVGDACQKCEDNKDKLELEEQINQLQQDLRIMKRMKNHPSYSKYNVQRLEKRLAEAKEKYKTKFGELPSSLNDNRERERERERESKFELGLLN